MITSMHIFKYYTFVNLKLIFLHYRTDYLLQKEFMDVTKIL